MWDDSATWDGRFYEGIQFLVSSDGKLEMSGCDSPDLEIF